MKKILNLLLMLTLIVFLCACGKATPEELAGKYESNSMFLKGKYQLNANGSYDKEPGTKGTFVATSKGGFTLTKANSSSEEVFAKKDDYYYRTNLICSFEKDDEYGLAPAFDENGKSNQSFSANYETINQSSMLVKTVELILNEDGTYKLNDLESYITKGKVVKKDKYEGTYRFEKDILWLKNEDKEYPILLIDGKLYFDVIQKTE